MDNKEQLQQEQGIEQLTDDEVQNAAGGGPLQYNVRCDMCGGVFFSLYELEKHKKICKLRARNNTHTA